MILSTDGGIATFGWAVVTPRTGRVVACGVLIQPARTDQYGVHEDRVRRASNQAAMLDRVITDHGVTRIAAEEMSFPPRSSAAAKVGIGLSWGSLIGLAHGRLENTAIIVVPPKTWQRAIVPAKPGAKKSDAINYAEVYAALERYVDVAELGLDQVPEKQRIHGFDAAGAGVYAALVLVEQEPGQQGAA